MFQGGAVSQTASLLVELFTEELPPKTLKKLGSEFAEIIFRGLRSRDFLVAESEATAYTTPRRLAVLISNVLNVSPVKPIDEKLIPVKVALDDKGNVTEAYKKALGKRGRQRLATATLDATDGPDKIYVRSDGKADYIYFRTLAKGQPLQRGLEEALEEMIEELPIPKVMRYQTKAGQNVEFVRPAHGLVALHGEAIVPVTVLGLDANRLSHGHRFQGQSEISLAHAEQYEEALLEQGSVIASFEKRRAAIERALLEHAQKLEASLNDYHALLDEVTALTENPAVYVGEFAPEFLAVPMECLVLTMQQHQRYFALFDAQGKLLPKFLLVSNMRLDDPSSVIQGNQRVVRPRLADARFFFEQDKKVRLDDRLAGLNSVVYHAKLGSQLDRVKRIERLSADIGRALRVDIQQTQRAARLCKADLLTDMVGEFPELQGVMGRYYALAQGESEAIAQAIEQHYRPRHAGDTLPDSELAVVLALADKLEALAGLFGIGIKSSGDKDPYGLRRHALGVVRILVEKKLPFAIHSLLDLAFAAFDGKISDAQAALQQFIIERLRGYVREQGYSPQIIEAALATPPDEFAEIPRILEATQRFLQLSEAKDLAGANKRVLNILKQAGTEAIDAKETQLQEPAERALYTALRNLRPAIEARYAERDYTAALLALASLKEPVNAFFDQVMVMVNDETLRGNRLALLGDLKRLMNRVVDISKLAM